ncbi:MAG: hypothetical protein M3457_16980 [Chloroflexota bacterium]|nr:hypothetical protein [Chloroflexota bacterium]
MQVKNAIRLVLALASVMAVTVSLMGSVSAAPPENHGSGKDRPGYCDPSFCPDDTAPEQSRGTFLYGEPGVDRRAFPEPTDGAGCTGASAINSNPTQASGDNAGYPSEQAADQANGGPFGQCYG